MPRTKGGPKAKAKRGASAPVASEVPPSSHDDNHDEEMEELGGTPTMMETQEDGNLVDEEAAVNGVASSKSNQDEIHAHEEDEASAEARDEAIALINDAKMAATAKEKSVLMRQITELVCRRKPQLAPEIVPELACFQVERDAAVRKQTLLTMLEACSTPANAPQQRTPKQTQILLQTALSAAVALAQDESTIVAKTALTNAAALLPKAMAHAADTEDAELWAACFSALSNADACLDDTTRPDGARMHAVKVLESFAMACELSSTTTQDAALASIILNGQPPAPSHPPLRQEGRRLVQRLTGLLQPHAFAQLPATVGIVIAQAAASLARQRATYFEPCVASLASLARSIHAPQETNNQVASTAAALKAALLGLVKTRHAGADDSAIQASRELMAQALEALGAGERAGSALRQVGRQEARERKEQAKRQAIEAAEAERAAKRAHFASLSGVPGSYADLPEVTDQDFIEQVIEQAVAVADVRNSQPLVSLMEDVPLIVLADTVIANCLSHAPDYGSLQQQFAMQGLPMTAPLQSLIGREAWAAAERAAARQPWTEPLEMKTDEAREVWHELLERLVRAFGTQCAEAAAHAGAPPGLPTSQALQAALVARTVADAGMSEVGSAASGTVGGGAPERSADAATIAKADERVVARLSELLASDSAPEAAHEFVCSWLMARWAAVRGQDDEPYCTLIAFLFDAVVRASPITSRFPAKMLLEAPHVPDGVLVTLGEMAAGTGAGAAAVVEANEAALAARRAADAAVEAALNPTDVAAAFSDPTQAEAEAADREAEASKSRERLDERATLALIALRDLAASRPPLRSAAVRQCLLACRSVDAVSRSKAVRLTANRIRMLPGACADDIHAFAAEGLEQAVAIGGVSDDEIVAATVQNNGNDDDDEMAEMAAAASIAAQEAAATARREREAQILDAGRYIALPLVLCTKQPDTMIPLVFAAFAREEAVALRAAVLSEAPKLAVALGANAPSMVALARDAPEGADELVATMVGALFAGPAPPTPPAALKKAMLVRASSRVRGTGAASRLLLTVLHSLTPQEADIALRRLVTELRGTDLRGALIRLVTRSQRPNSPPAPMQPHELMVSLHRLDVESSQDLRNAIEAVSECFQSRRVFTPESMASALAVLCEDSTLPKLLMRTAIQALAAAPELRNRLVDLLGRLTARQIWTREDLWPGFLLLARNAVPASCGILLQLPPRHLQDALTKHPQLKVPLQAEVRAHPSGVSRDALELLGLSGGGGGGGGG
ncbi:hypothetical protein PPROV_000445900 [Pycnococcus provasolii]|uniref:Symplekin C-terminal domain-containing protein n=4 Tax=Pycnococcus provasolii TaxID=41880 RepID=A0A830HK88_9CHLO|nr:hypothetical protein PPROV_000445900 [Pycnococcus provasolii]